MERKKVIALLIITLIIGSTATYLTFSFTERCKNLACWEEKLTKCRRASYISDTPDILWKYTIKGKKKESCFVEAEIIHIKQGLTETQTLEGKSMDCYLPRGIIMNPEANPEKCHGELKEEMQTLIIERLHGYILENIGTINEGLTKAI